MASGAKHPAGRPWTLQRKPVWRNRAPPFPSSTGGLSCSGGPSSAGGPSSGGPSSGGPMRACVWRVAGAMSLSRGDRARRRWGAARRREAGRGGRDGGGARAARNCARIPAAMASARPGARRGVRGGGHAGTRKLPKARGGGKARGRAPRAEAWRPWKEAGGDSERGREPWREGGREKERGKGRERERERERGRRGKATEGSQQTRREPARGPWGRAKETHPQAPPSTSHRPSGSAPHLAHPATVCLRLRLLLLRLVLGLFGAANLGPPRRAWPPGAPLGKPLAQGEPSCRGGPSCARGLP